MKIEFIGHASHRWSGWPGAYCMLCGIEDPIEIALADGFNFDINGNRIGTDNIGLYSFSVGVDAVPFVINVYSCRGNPELKDPYKIGIARHEQ